MGVNVFPQASGSTPTVPLVRGWAANSSGTFTLPETLTTGVYQIETDASTNMDGRQIGFVDTAGITWNATIRGGFGYFSLPRSASSIVMPSGPTYPVALSIYVSTQTQPAALTNTAITWASDKSYVTGTWDTPPTGVTGVTIYWQKSGTTYSAAFTSSTSGSTAAIATPGRPAATTAGIAYTLIGSTTNGLYSLPASGTTGAVPSASVTEIITASTSWVAPVSTTLTELVVIAGGGYGGGSYYAVTGGGGGAGGYRVSTTTAVTAGNTYTITVGGAASNSSFGSFAASGGGQGGSGGSNNDTPGGSGGGGSGTGGGPGGPGYTGSTGNIGGYSPAEGYAGGSGVGSTDAGGGGGAGGNGAQPTAGAGVTNSITGTSITYARGGGGGYGGDNGVTYTTYGSGAGGAKYGGGSAGTPQPGVVLIKYTF